MKSATKLVVGFLATMLAATLMHAQDPPVLNVVTADDIKWGPCGAGSSPGCAQAILFGDPRSPGLFTTRTKVPAGWRALPHYHSSEECATVLSGGPLHIALGDSFTDKAPSARAVGAGGFYCVPTGVHHFAWTERETLVQIHGVGPFIRTSVNP